MRMARVRHVVAFAFFAALEFPAVAPAASAGMPADVQLLGPPAFGADAQAPLDTGVRRARNVSIALHVLHDAAGSLTEKAGAPLQVSLPLFDGASATAQ